MPENIETIIESSEPSTVIQDALAEVTRRDDARNYPFPAGHDKSMEQAEAYSILARQVPGCEQYYRTPRTN